MDNGKLKMDNDNGKLKTTSLSIVHCQFSIGLWLYQIIVDIWSSVSEEPPGVLQCLHAVQVALRNDDRFFVIGLRKHRTGRVCNERSSPEVDMVFFPDAVHRGDIDGIRGTVTDLNRSPHLFP